MKVLNVNASDDLEIENAQFLPAIGAALANTSAKRTYRLATLIELLKTSDPAKIQSLSHNDIFSSWLDRKGYSKLADELRPIHGTGKSLADTLTAIIEKWASAYGQNLG